MMKRRITGFIWLDWVVEKLAVKHHVEPEEVEEVFFNPPYKLRRVEDDKYQLFGCNLDGRYLFVVFVWEGRQVKVITARDMTSRERRFMSKK